MSYSPLTSSVQLRFDLLVALLLFPALASERRLVVLLHTLYTQWAVACVKSCEAFVLLTIVYYLHGSLVSTTPRLSPPPTRSNPICALLSLFVVAINRKHKHSHTREIHCCIAICLLLVLAPVL